MSDTPETDAAVLASAGQWSFVLKETCQKLERERDEARADAKALAERLTALELSSTSELARLERERDEAREAIIATLEENRHLADGDDCTLAKLKSVVPDWK